MTTENLIGALAVAEFCELYSVGRTFLYEQIRAGHLRAVKAGTKTLILKAEAARWAQSLPELTRVGNAPAKNTSSRRAATLA